MTEKEHNFQTSRPLKNLFNTLLEAWAKSNRQDISDLAELCGVTTAYLSQITRYGRIPSKPVLILLAFNFGLKDPQQLFNAAEISDPWPYATNLGLEQRKNSRNLLELKFDEDSFKDLVREVVQQELRPRSLKQLTQGKHLRIGMNLQQSFLLKKQDSNYSGFFYDLLQQLSLFLQHRVDLIDTSYLDCFDLLQRGELDIYGPIYLTPQRLDQALFSEIMVEQGLSAIIRRSNFNSIPKLPDPKDLQDIASKPYVIAVLEGTASSHFVRNHCPNNQVLLCSSHTECIERVSLSLERQAHVLICDAGIAERSIKEDTHKLLSVKFNTPKTWLGTLGTSMAIRPDWRELKTLIDSALEFLADEDLFTQLYNKSFDSTEKNFVKLP
jgi:transcriptional regulator with XRE-family HTH domain